MYPFEMNNGHSVSVLEKIKETTLKRSKRKTKGVCEETFGVHNELRM